MTFALRRLVLPVALPLALLALLVTPGSQHLSAQQKATQQKKVHHDDEERQRDESQEAGKEIQSARRPGPPARARPRRRQRYCSVQ